MRRGSLFFIGLISAIVTIVSLNFAFGRPGYYYDRSSYYGRYHHCDNRYNDEQHNNRNQRDERSKTDSLNNFY